jgi:ribosome-binding factor A
MAGRGAGRGRGRSFDGGSHRYPRSVRVNEILREVLADQLERLEDIDARLGLLTITAVECEPDLRHALVLFSSMTEEEEEALGDARVRLQAAISREVRLKRTPQLRFAADPAISAGERIEDILRHLPRSSDDSYGGPDAAGARSDQ